MTFLTKKQNSDECYLKITSNKEFGIKIDFRFDETTAPSIANILFQLDSGLLTIPIVEQIQKECQNSNKNREYKAFMTAINIVSIAQADFIEQPVSEPIIKPSNVFRYTGEQPKFD